MLDATFFDLPDLVATLVALPDLVTFCRLDALGLQVVGQRLEPDRAVLACRIVESAEFARWCTLVPDEPANGHMHLAALRTALDEQVAAQLSLPCVKMTT